MQQVPKMYVLTPMTRGAAQQRRVVIQGFDIPWRAFVVASVTAIPALMLSLIAWQFVGQFAVVVFAGVEATAFVLIERRSSTGLKLRTYQTILDKHRSSVGIWFMCGKEIDPVVSIGGVVRSNTVPTAVPAVDVENVADAVTGRKRFRGISARVVNPRVASGSDLGAAT